MHQQPPKRFPWALYPACSGLDVDFLLVDLTPRTKTVLRVSARAFVGKEHDAELADNCDKNGGVEGQPERISLLPPDAFRTGVRLSTVQ